MAYRSPNLATGRLSASILADRPSALNTTGGFSATVRLTESLAIEVSGEATFRGDSPNEPANIDALDPVAVVLTGNDFDSVAYSSEVSLSYVLGNELVFSRDNRWR